ncbi:MAG TPA: alpha/beta fold hydrolase, partial [Xenococcaceae cyanobacterium]
MRKIIRLIQQNPLTCLAFSLLIGTLSATPVLSAERVVLSIPLAGEFYISVDSLATFAETGMITQDLKFYANRLDQRSLNQLRQVLRQRLDVPPVTVARLTNMPMGEDYLKRVGQIISTHPNHNGFLALRSALILAADDPEGLNLINILRNFPTRNIRVDTDFVLSLIKESANYLQYNETTVKAIAQQAAAEPATANLPPLPDLRQSGTYQVVKETVTFQIDRIRQTQMGLADFYDLDADIYLPQNLGRLAPLIVFTHGFGSNRANYDYLAEHLASHGFAVIVPEHIGSNTEYQQAFLKGEISVDISPIEFISRPRDVTYLLDALESASEWQKRLNFEQIGVIGHSFGGATALLLAGAQLNLARVSQVCQQEQFTLNASLLLQCRASYLPPGEYPLQDPRIKAVLAVSPVTSLVVGPEGMGEIEIPTMVLGGSNDLVAPFIAEQAHPFLWLQNPDKYLGVMVAGTHSSTSKAEEVARMPESLQGSRPDLGRNYLKALSLAFMETHVRDNQNYQPYLSTSYAQSISEAPLPLYLIESLTATQLERAYGTTPPKAPIPESLVADTPRRSESQLAAIQRTGVLKAAMRSDSPPFGYIDPQQDLWTGYCQELTDSLATYLARELNLTTGIEVIKLPSTAENRFELVQNKVALECGPNTITETATDISFSNPFFLSGIHFLVPQENSSNFDPESSLKNLRIGVLEATATEQYIQQTYPEAEIVFFAGKTGRTGGIEALINGAIDTFASDGILLSAEVARQNLNSDRYRLIPEAPLTCNFYGLILPSGDREWQKIVNNFLRQQQLALRQKWTARYSNQLLSDLD